MVLDYQTALRAIQAQLVLHEAGIAAIYIPDKLVTVSADPMATQWFVHRLEMPDAVADRALALLDEYSLRDHGRRSGPS